MLVRIREFFKIVKSVGIEVTLPQDFSITIVIQRTIFIMIQSKVKEKENDKKCECNLNKKVYIFFRLFILFKCTLLCTYYRSSISFADTVLTHAPTC